VLFEGVSLWLWLTPVSETRRARAGGARETWRWRRRRSGMDQNHKGNQARRQHWQPHMYIY
jgi:hypothetical protein